jgi:uncharacterized protein
MEQRMTMIGLGVKDLEVSKKFYETVFCWTRMQPENPNIVFYRLNGIILSLYPNDKLAEDASVSSAGNGFKGVTCAYNAQTEEDVDRLFSEFENKGVSIIKKPEKASWGGYSGYISDPDGHLWEFAFNPFWKLDSDGNLK